MGSLENLASGAVRGRSAGAHDRPGTTDDRPRPAGDRPRPAGDRPRPAGCCPLYHEAVELVGRRWTGAILRVLMDGPLRFSEIAQSVPELSDRLLSERMKELESRGIVARRVLSGPPVGVEYALSEMGRELEPALSELQRWAKRWLATRSATRI
jgi:DNA-binding HxlR family transcriptional regulator